MRKKTLLKSGNNWLVIQLSRLSNYVSNWLKINNFKNNILTKNSIEERFTWIYQNNHWGSCESASGTGSTLVYTKNLRKELPDLLKIYSIKSIFDAPCGDFNWMRHLLPNISVKYIGGDIVKPLIDELSLQYGNEKISFIHFDLVNEMPPSVDLMICRDCLFHLSYKDIHSVLRNFLESGIPYILTTTHVNNGSFVNVDISTGDFRLIDLAAYPFNFPANPIASIDDFIPPDPERKMCLYTREQIGLAVSSFYS